MMQRKGRGRRGTLVAYMSTCIGSHSISWWRVGFTEVVTHFALKCNATTGRRCQKSWTICEDIFSGEMNESSL